MMGQRRSRIVAAKDLRRGVRQGSAFTVGVEGEGREQVGSVCGGGQAWNLGTLRLAGGYGGGEKGKRVCIPIY